ncbi:MAG: hypothetical protein JNJ85_10720 [Candidatus Kapabacteria bacterium]|nr:hypothetical protein [Candidatus Kapabacteria bacterium]MBX7156066.1 hypothetical protein [Bacteroidota bacterium]
MAKKKKKDDDNNKAETELQQRVKYPIGFLFQMSTLIGCISFLMIIISGTEDVTRAMFRGFVLALGLAVIGGFILLTVVTVLHDIKMKEYKEKLKQLEEEQLARIEAQELELQRLEESRQEKVRQQKLALDAGLITASQPVVAGQTQVHEEQQEQHNA